MGQPVIDIRGSSRKRRTGMSRWTHLAAFTVVLLILGGGLVWVSLRGGGQSVGSESGLGKSLGTLFSFPVNSDQPGARLDPDVYHVPASPYPRGFNFIFLADGYLSWDEFDHDTQMLLREMKLVEPWKSYPRYNIYQIRPKELDLCGVKVADERKPVLRCNPDGVNRYLNALETGHFKLVVLSRRDFQSWANVVRLQDSGIFFSMPRPAGGPADETANGILFLHLLGHAFGLKDEEMFVIAKADSAPHQPDGPNCAPDRATAERWWGDLVGPEPGVGYFGGCAANKAFIKPTQGSLMNLGDLSQFTPTYGPVSERYLRKVLEYCFSETRHHIADDPNFFETYPEFKECVEL